METTPENYLSMRAKSSVEFSREVIRIRRTRECSISKMHARGRYTLRTGQRDSRMIVHSWENAREKTPLSRPRPTIIRSAHCSDAV
jgi:hypothetical protein